MKIRAFSGGGESNPLVRDVAIAAPVSKARGALHSLSPGGALTLDAAYSYKTTLWRPGIFPFVSAHMGL
jgi:hypothetical protein